MILALFVPATSPASAIFGLSKCEKVKKQVLGEEKIGLELQKSYRASLNGVKKLNLVNYGTIADSLFLVYESNKKVYQIMEKNQKCFTTIQNVNARKLRAAFTRHETMIKTSISNVAKYGLSNSDDLLKWFRERFTKYFSVYDIK